MSRCVAGIASSMLHSVFEAWFVESAKTLSAPQQWISDSFSLQYFADSVSAVLAGLVSQLAVMVGGVGAVFDVSAAILALATVTASLLWDETQAQVQPAPAPVRELEGGDADASNGASDSESACNEITCGAKEVLRRPVTAATVTPAQAYRR